MNRVRRKDTEKKHSSSELYGEKYADAFRGKVNPKPKPKPKPKPTPKASSPRIAIPPPAPAPTPTPPIRDVKKRVIIPKRDDFEVRGLGPDYENATMRKNPFKRANPIFGGDEEGEFELRRRPLEYKEHGEDSDDDEDDDDEDGDENERIDAFDGAGAYPFKSKVKYFPSSVIPQSKVKNVPVYFALKPLADLYQRPYFSPTLGSWELDVVFAAHPKWKNNYRLYLFAINLNSKYLEVFDLGSDHSLEQWFRCIDLLRKSHFVSNIRADGEIKPIVSNMKRGGLVDERIKGIHFHTSYSPYDNHNRCVDRVIRTIRHAVGPNMMKFRNLMLCAKCGELV
jgi:hypothetical protein